MRALTSSRSEPSFWDFVVPATVGGVASGAAGWGARQAFARSEKPHRDVAVFLASGIAFWVFSGLTWIVYTRGK